MPELNPDGISIKGCSTIYAPKGQAGEYAPLDTTLPLCACGCGEPVALTREGRPNTYIHGHAIPAAVRFLSYEPAIGPLVLPDEATQPDWIISGGESGGHARAMNPQWARDIRDQCQTKGIAYFHKQWGDYRSNPFVFEQGMTKREAEALDPKGNGKGGGLVDGRLWRDFPPSRAAISDLFAA